eukprot:72845_1
MLCSQARAKNSINVSYMREEIINEKSQSQIGIHPSRGLSPSTRRTWESSKSHGVVNRWGNIPYQHYYATPFHTSILNCSPSIMPPRSVLHTLYSNAALSRLNKSAAS